jgi:acetyl esterase/lipase
LIGGISSLVGWIVNDRCLRPRHYDKTWLDKNLTCMRAFPAYRHGICRGGAYLLIHLLGSTLKEEPEVYRLASPIVHVGAHFPPTLPLSGDSDFVVDASHSRNLHQALRKAKVPSLYIEYAHTVHAFDLYFGVSRCVTSAAHSPPGKLKGFWR